MDFYQAGAQFAMGILSVVGKVVLLILALQLVYGLTGWGVDSTDKSKWKRSGVAVITDAKTGLQYLKTAGGGLTPRLDNSGAHMTEIADESGSVR